MAKSSKVADVREDDNDDIMSIIEFSEDISDAEAPEPLPERTYPAEIMKVERKESNSGNVYAAVTFTVKEDDYPADYPAENAPGQTNFVYRRVTLEDTPPARHRLKKFCQAIGAPMSKRINLDDWVGLSATVEVKHGEWEGEKRAEVFKVTEA